MSTLTVYPAAGSVSPVDGFTQRSSVSESFSTIIAGAGTSAAATDSNNTPAYVAGSAGTDVYTSLVRGVFLFDTSALTVDVVINSATISFFAPATDAKNNTLGSPDLHVVSSSPASNDALVADDFSTLGSTSFGNITYANYTANQYNDIVLNASGLAAISKNGLTKLGLRLSWDINGSVPGSANGVAFFRTYFADQTGTANDPKLVINYSPVIDRGNPTFFSNTFAIG